MRTIDGGIILLLIVVFGLLAVFLGSGLTIGGFVNTEEPQPLAEAEATHPFPAYKMSTWRAVHGYVITEGGKVKAEELVNAFKSMNPPPEEFSVNDCFACHKPQFCNTCHAFAAVDLY